MHFDCPHCLNPIEVAAQEPLNEVICPSCGSSIQLDPGQTAPFLPSEGRRRVGKFEFLEQLGVGAFGIVYKARDTELDRLVAIKVPRAGNLATKADIELFLREARSAAQLKHPSIVSVHDAAQTDGSCYLVSELVHGTTLADHLTTKRLSFRESAALLAEVGDALNYAHRKGVIHRDLKPSNIMLDLDGKPHVMDFGLAKREATEITITVDGQILGTPAYMPPEQARGEGHKVDARGDVYSLGVILYELLTGEIPFRGNSRMLIVQVLQDEPRPPRRINDKIPRDLETICLKAMSKQPARRYSTASDFADDLKRYLAHEPILGRPVGRIERAWSWCRRYPAVAALGSAIVLLLFLIATIATASAVRLAALANRERIATQNFRSAAARADARTVEALSSEKRAEEKADEAWTNLYAAQMNVAQSNWEAARPLPAIKALEQLLPKDTEKDLRGFEWHYQWGLCHENLRVLSGHGREIYCVAFSPDARIVATASSDRTARLWDVARGAELRTLKGHTDGVSGVAFSPDGGRIATASWDKTIKLWDVTNGLELRTLTGHGDSVYRVAFSPAGDRVASASKDLTVKVWDPSTGLLIYTLTGHTGAVEGVAFSPDGKRLASCGADNTVKVWNVTSRSEQLTLKGHINSVLNVAFSPCGQRLASASRDRTLKLWDSANGAELRTFQGHADTVFGLAFGPDGERLASASWDRTLKIWDVESGRDLKTFRGHTREILSVSFSPDGRLLASGGHDQSLKIWDSTTDSRFRSLSGHIGSVLSVAFSPDGKLLASAGEDHSIKIWDVLTGIPIRTLLGHTNRIWRVEFSTDGKWIASACDDCTLKLWHADTGVELRTLRGHRAAVASVSFSPDGRSLASGSMDGTIKIWDLTAGHELHTLNGHSAGVHSVAFSQDGKHLASGSEDLTIKLWEVGTWKELHTLTGHSQPIMTVAFSPDSKLLSSASDGHGDPMIKLWDVQSGIEVRTLVGHVVGISNVVFSPDGRRLASAGVDWNGKVWDVATGRELYAFTPNQMVIGIAFSPDGQQLAMGIGDGTVKIADGRPLTAAHQVQREARGLVEFLLTKHTSKAHVVDQIRDNQTISSDVQLVATELVDRYLAANDQWQAHKIVEDLRRVYPIKSELIAAIEKDAILSAEVRRDAIEIAQDHDDRNINVNSLHRDAWRIVSRPGAEKDDYRKAVRWATAANRLLPDNGFIVNTLGVAQFRAGDYSAAVQSLTHSAELNAKAYGQPHPLDLAFLAMAHLQSDQREKALTLLTPLLQSTQGTHWRPSPQIQESLNETLAAFPLDDLWTFFHQEWKDGRLHINFAKILANRLQAQQRYAQAVDTLSALIEVNSQDPQAFVQRADLYLKLGELQKAVGDFASAAKLGNEHQSHIQGLAHAKLGQWNESAIAYGKAVQQRPDDVELLCEYAPVLLLANKTVDLDGLRVNVLERFSEPQDPRTSNVIARIATIAPLTDNTDRVIKLAEHAVKADPKAPWFLHALAMAHFRAADFDEAVRYSNESLTAGPEWPATVLNWLVLAMAHHRLGNVEESQRWWDKTSRWLEGSDGLPKIYHEVLPLHAHDWLGLQCLQREFEHLLKADQ